MYLRSLVASAGRLGSCAKHDDSPDWMHQCAVMESLSNLDITSDGSGASAGEGNGTGCALLESATDSVVR